MKLTAGLRKAGRLGAALLVVAGLLGAVGAQRAAASDPDMPYGFDTCKSGYVWREAFQGDVACVEPHRRAQAAADNAQAAARRVPNGGAYGPNTCKPGYVWREARTPLQVVLGKPSADLVCVTPEERARTAIDNNLANERRVDPVGFISQP